MTRAVLVGAAIVAATVPATGAAERRANLPVAFLPALTADVSGHPVSGTRVFLARTLRQARPWLQRVPKAYRPPIREVDYRIKAVLVVVHEGRDVAAAIRSVRRDGDALTVTVAEAPTFDPPRVSAWGWTEVAVVRKVDVRGVTRVAVEDEGRWAPPPSPPTVRPSVTASAAPPHAGRIFYGVRARFQPPMLFLVQRVSCDATLGGHFETRGEFRILRGGRYIAPLLRASVDANGFLSRVECGWRIPKRATGQLLSLAAPGCGDACGYWGLTIQFMAGRQGPGVASYFGGNWIVRRP